MSVDLLKTMADLPADLKLQCLRLLKAKPEVEDELKAMYELDSVAGVKVVLAQHGFLPTESAINVYGGTANLYFGCTFGGVSKTAAAKKRSKKDPSWQASDKLFLHDVWINKVYAPLKKAGLKIHVANGENMGNAATKRLLGGDLKSFGKIHANEAPGTVHTSKVLHGTGPEGYLELAPEVLKKAISEGLVTEPPSSSSTPSAPAATASSSMTSTSTASTPSTSSGGAQALAGINLSKISFHGTKS